MKAAWHICGPATNSYMRWEDESAKRHKRGERQVQCRGCSLWYWPSWDEDKAKHDACPVPKCEKCGSKNTVPAFMQFDKRNAIYVGERCQDCKHVPEAMKRTKAEHLNEDLKP